MQLSTMDTVARETRIDGLLAAARETIVQVPFCWVVTPTPDGAGANARVVKAQPGRDSEDFWTRWFLTPRLGRKAAEIRAIGRVRLALSARFRGCLCHPCRSGRTDRRPGGSRQQVSWFGLRRASRHYRRQLDRGQGDGRSLGAARARRNREPWGRGRTLLAVTPEDVAPSLIETAWANVLIVGCPCAWGITGHKYNRRVAGVDLCGLQHQSLIQNIISDTARGTGDPASASCRAAGSVPTIG